jgi:hypothetical protein
MSAPNIFFVARLRDGRNQEGPNGTFLLNEAAAIALND